MHTDDGGGRGDGDRWQPGGSDDGVRVAPEARRARTPRGARVCRHRLPTRLDLLLRGRARLAAHAHANRPSLLTSSQANPAGLAILVACGLWAYFEYKRPGGKLNPNAAQYKAQQDAEARRKRMSEAVRLS